MLEAVNKCSVASISSTNSAQPQRHAALVGAAGGERRTGGGKTGPRKRA